MKDDFDYVSHYKIDAEEFDYFESRKGATLHDERRVHEFIFSQVGNKVNSILDVGCGSAWVASKYIPRNKKVFSLDISKLNVTKALTTYPSMQHYGTIADSYYLPFKNDAFDIIIASEVIEHVVSPKDFVKELYRCVNPGGKLILTTPYKEVLRYVLCVHCNKKTPVHAHIHSFDKNAIEQILQECGIGNFRQILFGNKILIFLRTYALLKFLPFQLWKVIDRITNIFYNIPAHLQVVINKE